ncbi:MAG: haloacid dehalogenase-like hydrolase [Intestinibacter sp.]|uniref:haloacid dehalogenase-like hydrolase n=1 Tax=Intestinibacter sp. TaxID=1965304 RepID=UPI002A7F65DC|nr:haloacid dehalogenase-like hydrolase [Intestinibacter sp.]MDY4575251.1 haloacid dehalogenase-like hydrolase [Intestinibacter sp.]
MANIIAVVWDFDKTLVNGYMQDPIFKYYGEDSKNFWNEVNSLPEKYESQGVKVNKDTIYLNQFIKYAKEGKFKGLNNDKLREFGKELDFYKGIPEIFQKTKEKIEGNTKYKLYGIEVEHYIVSTGMKQIIEGSNIRKFIQQVWACELIEDVDPENPEEKIISEIGYTIDNTSKTRALFEINKGVGILEDIDVNMKIAKEFRRVQFENMIYIADGPSDIPAFSVVKKNGGSTFAIYPKGKEKEFKQVEQMRKDGRIDMFAEADYSEGTTAYMWIMNKIEEYADRIYKSERDKISPGGTPKHIID